MKKYFIVLGIISFLFMLTAKESTNLFTDGGFENIPSKWQLCKMAKITSEAARGGSLGLHIIDKDAKNGSSVLSQAINIKSGDFLYLSFYAKSIKPNNATGIYIHFFDKKGKKIAASATKKDAIFRFKTKTEWQKYNFKWQAPEGANSVKIWIHTFNIAQGEISFDDFDLNIISL